MIEVSDAYLDLVEQNIRPKCEPEIRVSGVDANGNNLDLVWTSSNIKDLTYKRGIDPIGRELPFMELTWTEIYSGKLDVNLYPEKYNNVTNYMKVELSFYQNLSFYNTWKLILSSGKTWKSFLGKTWKQIKDDIPKEKITLPVLFLSAKPTYKNQTITWKAVDALSLLQEKQTKDFTADIDFVNPVRYLLINEMGNFLSSKDILSCLKKCEQNVIDWQNNNLAKMEYATIFNGSTKDVIANYLKLRNLHLDFESNGAFALQKTDFGAMVESAFPSKVLRAFPELQNCPNVSSYSFKSYSVIRSPEKTYTKTPSYYYDLYGKRIYITEFDGYGDVEGEVSALTYSLTADEEPVTITPINLTSQDNTLIDNTGGEAFVEDNKINPYNSKTEYMYQRFEFLKRYFNSSSSLKFSCLPNLAVETGDAVRVETNLIDTSYLESATNIIKKCLIVGIELKYSGTIKQTITAHEIVEVK